MTRAACVLVALLSLLTVGCASTQANVKKDPRDPFERVNRVTFKFNDVLDRHIVRPVAVGYRKVTPDVMQTGITNFFTNLTQPRQIVNNVLQGKFKPALSDTGRFLLNSTLGVGGLFDPASDAGLARSDEDFGQTLGKWGVPSGPYVVIPFYGPSTIRDGIGSAADIFTDPINYVEEDKIRYSVWAFDLLDTRARLLDADQALRGAFDPYAFLRNVYLQRRAYQVSDGNVPTPTFEDEIEDPDPDADKR